MPGGRLALLDIERPGDPDVFGPEVRAAAAEIIARYPAGQSRSALLPMLHLVQSEQGYVTPDGIAFCADQLNLTKAQVVAVATFYTMYKRQPTGEYLVSVCTNTLCGLLGGDEIYQALSELLGVGMNQTDRRRLDHAGARRVPGRLRLRAGGHRQLRVLRQPDPGLGGRTGERAARREPSAAEPRRAAVQLPRDLPPDRRIRRRPAGGTNRRRHRRAHRGRRPAGPAAERAGAGLWPGRAELAGEQGSQGQSQRGSSPAHAERAAEDNTGARTGSSAHDEPLQTAKSDPAAGSKTGGQSERIEKGE